MLTCPVCGRAVNELTYTGIRDGKVAIGSMYRQGGGECMLCSPPP